MDNEISAVPKMKKKWNSKSERELQFETTDSSADDEIIDSHNELVLHKKGVNVTASTSILPSSTDTNSNNELICAPVEDCELCPHKWKQSLEMVEEKIKGELESCVKYGRRQRFECTVLFQENETTEKVARGRTEYKPCRFTEYDEEFRLIQMQIICLIVGLWSVRNVRRYKMTSASLFDQRRMMTRNNNQGGDSANGSNTSKSITAKYYSKKDSMDSVELGPLIPVVSGPGKVPKSPAPNIV